MASLLYLKLGIGVQESTQRTDHTSLELEIQDLVWKTHLRNLKASLADVDRTRRRALHWE